MIDTKMKNAINKQINHELAAAFNYLAMAAWLESRNYPGFASWMYLQRQEEHAHAQRLINFLLDRGGNLELAAVQKPSTQYNSPLEAFQSGLEMEQLNTKTIDELYELARQLNDYATESHLKWFIDEQVEEEKNASDAVAQLKLTGDFGPGLLMMDREMATRMPAPAIEAGA